MIATYFLRNGESGVFLAQSDDGFVFVPVSENPILAPLPGQLTRDPHVLKTEEGWIMVWTTGWWTNSFGIARSNDGREWTDAMAIPVMENFPGTSNVWAPESMIDPDSGELIVFWSSTVEGAFPETERADGDKDDKGRPLNHRFYYATSREYGKFEPAKLLWNPGFNCIDATMLKIGGRYLMFGKDDTTAPSPAKFIFAAEARHPLGPWKIVQRRITGDYWAEGPTAVSLGDKVRVYFDRYTENRWGAVESSDLETWLDVSDSVRFVDGGRHGTVIVGGLGLPR